MEKYLLRKATSDDMHFLFELRNEDSVRLQSFQQQKIILEDHEKWFQKKMKSPYTDIFIFEKNGASIGQARVDMDNASQWGEISYAIQYEYRGMGLGLQMLERMERIEKKKIKCGLCAKVKKDNIASCCIFEKLGYDRTNIDGGYQYVKSWNVQNDDQAERND